MFNYLHCFLFLSEPDNKFKSQNLKAKWSRHTFSKLLLHLCQMLLKQLPLKHEVFLNVVANTDSKKFLNTFFKIINTENKLWLKKKLSILGLFENVLVLFSENVVIGYVALFNSQFSQH